MQERTRNIAVGLTAIAGLIVLAMLLVLFGYLPQFLESGYVVRVLLDDAGGLRLASRVTYNGIDVGQVESVTLAEPPQTGVVAVVRIEGHVSLPADLKAYVSGPIFTGSPVLTLTPATPATPSDEPQAFLPKDGTAEIRGQAKSLTEGLAERLSQELAGPLQRLESVGASFETLSKEWTEVGRNINQLVQPRTPESVDQGEAAGNLASLIARADSRMAELREVLAGLHRTIEDVQLWVGDEEMRKNVHATVVNARELTGKLSEQVDVLSKRYVAVADDLSQAIRTLNQTLELARDGKGSVGKFLNDPALYNNLNDAAQRLTAAMDELNLLLEQFRKEGIPLEFGGN